MSLKGVSYPKIDHELFDKAKYNEILNKILDHTRKHLTTKSMANYVLETDKIYRKWQNPLSIARSFPRLFEMFIAYRSKRVSGRKSG